MAAHHLRLMTIEDTPHSIALGSAIGIFFGFTPLLGLKTLLSIAVAWIFRSNKIAAAISVTLHDVILPLMPAFYLWEYKIGMLVMHGHIPGRTGFRHFAVREVINWTAFFNVGLPVLIGSLFLGLPVAVAVYFFMRGLVSQTRASQHKAASTETS
jgi:uncharacterized protein (DUF2062 family)